MPKKKILICEDCPEIEVRNFSALLEEMGYDVSVLAKEGEPNYVLDNIEETVRREQPKILIIDGLEGRCYEVAKKALKINPDILPIIDSGNRMIVEEARIKGYYAFFKDYKSLDKLLEFIGASQ
tara:strand:+ start:436 stop:807 length:372 start_codon:yes stop_codon:yes gene_type:complete